MASNAAFQPDIWVLLSHAPGDNDQCLALAEALDRPTTIKRVDWPLVGGEVKQFAASEQALVDAARRAQEAADLHGGSVVVTTSRRTPPSLLATVEGMLDRAHIHRWSDASAEENPYDVLLSQSAALFVTADSASMILDGCGSGTPTFVIEYPERPSLRQRWQQGLFRLIRRAVERLHRSGLPRVGEVLDRAQDWLHARGIVPYPKDLRRIHASVYRMELARPVTVFDPGTVPPRKPANDLIGSAEIRAVAARCRALHDGRPRRAAE